MKKIIAVLLILLVVLNVVSCGEKMVKLKKGTVEPAKEEVSERVQDKLFIETVSNLQNGKFNDVVKTFNFLNLPANADEETIKYLQSMYMLIEYKKEDDGTYTIKYPDAYYHIKNTKDIKGMQAMVDSGDVKYIEEKGVKIDVLGDKALYNDKLFRVLSLLPPSEEAEDVK